MRSTSGPSLIVNEPTVRLPSNSFDADRVRSEAPTATSDDPFPEARRSSSLRRSISCGTWRTRSSSGGRLTSEDDPNRSPRRSGSLSASRLFGCRAARPTRSASETMASPNAVGRDAPPLEPGAAEPLPSTPRSTRSSFFPWGAVRSLRSSSELDSPSQRSTSSGSSRSRSGSRAHRDLGDAEPDARGWAGEGAGYTGRHEQPRFPPGSSREVMITLPRGARGGQQLLAHTEFGEVMVKLPPHSRPVSTTLPLDCHPDPTPSMPTDIRAPV